MKRTFGCILDEAGWRGAGRRQAENEEQDKKVKYEDGNGEDA
ncbi:hypothetical protein [Paraprevotella xylaniphila]|nr:hypothetical protein [Paraprevotella xylaniphila]